MRIDDSISKNIQKSPERRILELQQKIEEQETLINGMSRMVALYKDSCTQNLIKWHELNKLYRSLPRIIKICKNLCKHLPDKKRRKIYKKWFTKLTKKVKKTKNQKLISIVEKEDKR